MRGWFRDRYRHALSARGILSCEQKVPYSQLGCKLSINEKRLKGKRAERLVVDLLRSMTDYIVENVSDSNRGIGDIQVELHTRFGDCIALVELKDTEELVIDNFSKQLCRPGRPAIHPPYHFQLIENARRLGAVPLYFFKFNRELEPGTICSEIYYVRAERLSDDVARMRGVWYQPSISYIKSIAEPVDEDFGLFLRECETQHLMETGVLQVPKERFGP